MECLKKDKVLRSLTSTDAEDKILVEVLDDSCKAAMKCNLSEMCEKDPPNLITSKSALKR